MIIRVALFLVLVALASLVSGMMADAYQLAKLATVLVDAGRFSLACAFLLFLLPVLVTVGYQTRCHIAHYWSKQQRMERKLWFYLNKHKQLVSNNYFKKNRVIFMAMINRKRISKRLERKSRIT